MGKGIGNGYPVSVTALGPAVIDRLGDKPIHYAQSHQNDPLGAAVAREVVRVIEDEDLIARGREMAVLLLNGLKGIRKRTQRIRDLRSRGLMIAIELEDTLEAPFTGRVQRELVRRGYVVARRPGLGVLRLDPSLTIDPKDIEGFLEMFEAVLSTEEASFASSR